MSLLMRLAVGAGVLILVAGCGLVPEIAHQPTYHNPFPQLTKVAVAPFFNASTESTVDGRQFANAYFHELQAIPGFEVVPVGIVEEKARELGLSLANPVEVRKLAQELEVDAVVIGAVTDYSPFYPPRCAMQVEWYTANPCFHPIPVGYGLPWGTPEEEYIPDSLVLETELGLAREQLKTQTPAFTNQTTVPVDHRGHPKSGNLMAMLSGRNRKTASAKAGPPETDRTAAEPKQYPVRQLSYTGSEPPTNGSVENAAGETVDALPSVMSRRSQTAVARSAAPEEIAPPPIPGPLAAAMPPVAGVTPAALAVAPLPPNWPDPRGLVPPAPAAQCPDCRPTFEPVLRHTRAYNGNDVRFTTALESYVFFRDEARLGGWQTYLQRSDDFIRFCCHMHITEMLTARGGAGETRVVWRWPDGR
jgi:hypothetical protein